MPVVAVSPTASSLSGRELGIGAVGAFSREEHNAGVNAISQFPKRDEPTVAWLRDFGRIVERPVKLHWVPWKVGATLPRPVTNGDHKIKSLPCKFFQRF